MFDSHLLNPRGLAEMKLFKNDMAKAVVSAMELMDDCAEKTIFLRKIEEAVFFGAKAIAQKEINSMSKTGYPLAE